MHIVIVGPGALGSLLTARIALFIEQNWANGAGKDLPELLLLDHRRERADTIRKSGLLFEEKGQSTLCRVRVESDPELCRGGDVLFLCVKAAAVTGALERLAPHVSPDALLLAMQNGIGHLDAVAEFPCVGGVGITSEGATLVAPGHVRHGGSGITRIGILGPETEAGITRLAETAELLGAAGLATEITSEPLKYVWAKLFVNVAINALTAIHRCRNGELLHSQANRDTMRKAVLEAVSVAGALDIPVDDDPVEAAFRVCETTATNISSMHQDVRNLRRTEIDAINGAIAAHGRRLGIPTPVNEELVRQVRLIEASYSQ